MVPVVFFAFFLVTTLMCTGLSCSKTLVAPSDRASLMDVYGLLAFSNSGPWIDPLLDKYGVDDIRFVRDFESKLFDLLGNDAEFIHAWDEFHKDAVDHFLARQDAGTCDARFYTFVEWDPRSFRLSRKTQINDEKDLKKFDRYIHACWGGGSLSLARRVCFFSSLYDHGVIRWKTWWARRKDPYPIKVQIYHPSSVGPRYGPAFYFGSPLTYDKESRARDFGSIELDGYVKRMEKEAAARSKKIAP